MRYPWLLSSMMLGITIGAVVAQYDEPSGPSCVAVGSARPAGLAEDDVWYCNPDGSFPRPSDLTPKDWCD